MILIFMAQLLVPIALIIWVAAAPPRSGFGFAAQLFGVGIILLALAFTGLWLFPPWWTPYAFAALLIAAAALALRRRWPFPSALPVSTGARAVALLWLGVSVAAGQRAMVAWAGSAPQSTKSVDLRFPLASGTYLVVNGGNAEVLNAHLKTLDITVPRFRAYRGQSFALDIVEVDWLGLRAKGLQPTDPAAYYIYGRSVLAPCTGEVLAAVDGLPDMRVPATDRAHMAGNHIMLDCEGVDVLLGHLRPGSVAVVAGSRVRAGERLAAVGNSGNTGEPHMHIHAQRPGTASAPLSGDPLPMRFEGRTLVRSDRVTVRP